MSLKKKDIFSSDEGCQLSGPNNQLCENLMGCHRFICFIDLPPEF